MRETSARREKMLPIAAVACDLDGVLTNGLLPYGPDGDCLKSFGTHDNVGFRLAAAAGWPTAVITARRSAMTERWAADLKLPELHQGVTDKAACLTEFAAAHQLELRQIAFVGDDLLDLPAMLAAGLGVAPADAVLVVRRKADLVLDSPGGRGALRELVDRLIEAQGRTTEVLGAYYAAQRVEFDPAVIEEVTEQAATRIGFGR